MPLIPMSAGGTYVPPVGKADDTVVVRGGKNRSSSREVSGDRTLSTRTRSDSDDGYDAIDMLPAPLSPPTHRSFI